jgi:sugar transferase (PEP-CTERM/EpsH1 system associated)
VSLRVLFLTHRLPYAPNRGDRLRAYHILRTLAAEAAQTDVISLVHDEEEAAQAGAMTAFTNSVQVARVPRIGNLARGLLHLPTRRPLTHSLLDSPEVAPAIARVLAKHPPDVVLAFCSGMVRFAMEPPLLHIPCVLDMVDADSAKWAALAASSHIPKRFIYAREARCLSRFEVDAMRHARATLIVNDRERQLLQALDATARLLVMENGVDLEMFRPQAPPGPSQTVVFCGVMNYAPNEEGALWMAREVWPRVKQQNPGASLMIVGASPTLAVRTLAQMDTSITVTGTVPDVRPFLWSAAVAAAPLQTARGVQNKVLEALAAGIPVVATPVVAEGLSDGTRVGVSVAGDPDAFAASLLHLLKMSPAARRNIAASANLRELTWRERLKNLVPLLEEVSRVRVTVH